MTNTDDIDLTAIHHFKYLSWEKTGFVDDRMYCEIREYVYYYLIDRLTPEDKSGLVIGNPYSMILRTIERPL